MYENLELIQQHHQRDLMREAKQAQLASEAMKGQRKPKKALRAGLVSILASLIHIR